MSRYKEFRPDWEHQPPVPGSFRSIFKWGDPATFKEPNERLYRLIKESFGLTEEDFRHKTAEGNEPVPEHLPVHLSSTVIAGLENVPDVVLFPQSKEQIEAIVSLCAREQVPLYVYGGGSSVTQGVEAVRGGITLDLRKHFTTVISFSEVNQTMTVEAGISGPDLEAALNGAPARFGASRAYTCGHFP